MSARTALGISPSAREILDRAREVITLEAYSLEQLSQSLDNAFVAACGLLLRSRGRIVVSGIGKSGHIGRKIAATLAATGSAAIYVHPGEAAHGDLGMLVPGDVLLAISNSGNTAEIRTILEHARAMRIPAVGVTSVKDSLVGRLSDVCVVIPKVVEACPGNISPTSSTTQQLALGDAFAMVLMELRGFGKDEVKALHPGGMIGLRLAQVDELMHGTDELPLVVPEMPMDEVISCMTSRGFGIAGVVDAGGRLTGIITDGDLRRHFALLHELTAAEVMTRHPKVLRAGMPAEEALRFLNHAQVTCAFVVEGAEPACSAVNDENQVTGNQVPIGIIHVHDFLRMGLA